MDFLRIFSGVPEVRGFLSIYSNGPIEPHVVNSFKRIFFWKNIFKNPRFAALPDEFLKNLRFVV